MKAKLKNILVGALSAVMLAAIPVAASTIEKAQTPVAVEAATPTLDSTQNLATNKWDWNVDQTGSGVTTFSESGMRLEGIDNMSSPFAIYKTNSLSEFKYSMYATINLTTPHDLGVEPQGGREWDFSTAYISFMIETDTPYASLTTPYKGPAHFSVCFEKIHLETKYCSSCPSSADRQLSTSGTCNTCGGTEYNVNSRDYEVIRLYRNEVYLNQGYNRIAIAEKSWWDTVDEEKGGDTNFDGVIDENDVSDENGNVGVHFVDGNSHWFEFEQTKTSSGITVNFYFDGNLMFQVGQSNMNDDTGKYSEKTGYLGFWTDSSLPASSDTGCYIDIEQLGIAPITNGTVGSYYTQAEKPNFQITANAYTALAEYTKGDEIEIALTDLFTYEGDEEVSYTFVDTENNNESVGEIRNGYWVWTPLTGDYANIKATATVLDGTGTKTANNYIEMFLVGDDIVVDPLPSPTVTLSENIASWSDVDGAGSYVYRIGINGDENTAESNSITLLDGETLYVKAMSSNITKYWHSEWSDPVTYKATKLTVPTITMSGNTANWTAVSGAVSYNFKIDGGEVENTTDAFVQGRLKHNQTIEVQAVGNGVTTLDSEWSFPSTYVADSLATPRVTLTGDTATWTTIANATGYVYKIGASGTETNATSNSVTLTNGQTLYVKALGNGETLLDSSWSNPVTYTAPALNAPVVSLEENEATWSSITGATGYVYKIGVNGEEQTASGNSVTLTNGQTIYVKAVGDNMTCTDSAWSEGVTYSANMLKAPVVTLSNNVASWAAVDGAQGYVYKINGGTEQTANGTSVTLKHGESIRVQAVGDGATSLSSNWSTAVTYTASALNVPVVTLSNNVASWTAVDGAVGYAYKIGATGTEKTTNGTSVTLSHSQTLYVKAVGNGETNLDSSWSNPVTYTASALATPSVAMDGNAAKWDAVDGAQGYAYKINGGTENTTTDLSVTLTSGQTITVKALGNSTTSLDSAWSEAITFSANSLATPVVTLDGNEATWNEVENAIGYVCVINGVEQPQMTERSVVLTNGQTLQVKAIGDGVVWTNSGLSERVTYRANMLAKPQVTLQGNVASWANVANASGYVYKIGANGEEKTATSNSVTLTSGETIYVKALGDNTLYMDGNWSDGVTFVAAALDAPTVTLDEDKATWSTVANATGYVYKIGVNGEEQEATGDSVTLTNGQTIFVKALGDGTLYLDSAWASKTYNAGALGQPNVTLSGNVASWTAVEGASAYVYKINEGVEKTTTDLSVTLTHGQSIKVKAVSEGMNDSFWSDKVTYTASALIAPVVTLNENVASWTAVDGAVRYVYKIGANGEEKTAIGTSVTMESGETLYVMAVGNNETSLNSAWSNSVTYIAETLAVPNVSLKGNTASWESVDGASGYVYKIGVTGVEMPVNGTSVVLTHNQTIYVKAVGDGEKYLDSGWSNGMQYTAIVLAVPQVRLNGNTADWEVVDGASGYVYKIGANGEEKTIADTSVTLTHNQTLYVKAMGDDETKLDSSWSTAVTYKASPLATPVVTLDNNVASWVAVDDAIGYVYKIGVTGAETSTTETSVTLKHNQTVYVKALGDNLTALGSGWSTAVTYTASALTTPVVTLNGNEASWTAVDGAVGYAYKIGVTGTETSTTETSVTLTHNQTVYVKALGNDETAFDSGWSEGATYTASALTAPVVTLNGNVASWTAVDGAVGYAYKIDNGNVQNTTETSVTLSNAQSITVCAMGDKTTYLDGAWSTAVTFTASALATPTVTLNGNEVSWTAVDGAVGYEYRIDNGEFTQTTETSVTLTSGQSIIVKALGDGVTCLNGGWSTKVTYALAALAVPTITFDKNVASWTAVEGASGYAYRINGGAEKTTKKTSVELAHGQSIAVKALGDGESVDDSAWAVSARYVATTLGEVTLTINGNVARWTAVEGASEYVYKINGGEEQRTTNTFITLKDGEYVQVKAVGDNKAYLDGTWSNVVGFEYGNGTYTGQVEETGGCESVVGTVGVTVMLLAAGLCLAVKRRGEEKQ